MHAAGYNNGVRVIVAGSDMDYTGKLFQSMLAADGHCEYVTKVHAICVRLRQPQAPFGTATTQTTQQVMFGAQDSYAGTHLPPIANKLANGGKRVTPGHRAGHR